MTSKLILALFCLTLPCTSTVFSQNISFDYDNSGNCIVKYKTVVLARTPVNHNNEQQANRSDSTWTQVSDIGGRKVTVYPNPTKGLLTMELIGKQLESTVEFRLIDLSGKLLMKGQFEYRWLRLDLSHLLPGTYMLQIYVDSKQDVWKIIKE